MGGVCCGGGGVVGGEVAGGVIGGLMSTYGIYRAGLGREGIDTRDGICWHVLMYESMVREALSLGLGIA